MSRFNKYVPNPIIVDRAVSLWIDALRKPKFDNGDPSPSGLLASGLAKMIPSNATEELLTAFGRQLRIKMMDGYDWKWTDGTIHRHDPVNYLSVDYRPDPSLAQAAEEVGLKTEFPWKTNMSLSENYVAFAIGYGAEPEYHYPLAGGQWLVTKLHGADMAKIIALVESGKISTQLT